MVVSKQSQDGTGFVTAVIDRMFSWEGCVMDQLI